MPAYSVVTVSQLTYEIIHHRFSTKILVCRTMGRLHKIGIALATVDEPRQTQVPDQYLAGKVAS